jgi:hypothetical protein
MGLFKPAENTMAYAKVGLLGFAGSGKTRTAWEIAKGLHMRLASKRPVAFLDTETGSDFILPLAKQAGIELLVSKTRAFKDLTAGIKEAEKITDILMIDSVSHYWVDLVESYKKRKGVNRLAFQDWGILKPMWNEFSTWYVTSAVHTIVCGRAGFEYDYFEGDEGKMELYKTGTKMKAEGEFGFEPSLLIEMERIRNPEASDEYQKAKTKEAREKAASKLRASRQWVRRASVLKDRAEVLDGKFFDNPTFEDFSPHWNFINIGGEHRPIETGDSQGMFDREGKPEWKKDKERGQIILEEIEAEMIKANLAGTGKDERKNKITMLEFLFGTSSWSAIQALALHELKDGLDSLKAASQTPSFMESIIAKEVTHKDFVEMREGAAQDDNADVPLEPGQGQLELTG